MASKHDLVDHCSSLLELSWNLGHRPRVEGGNNEYCQGHCYHGPPQFHPHVEHNYYNPTFNANNDLRPCNGCKNATARKSSPPKAKDSVRSRCRPPNDLRPKFPVNVHCPFYDNSPDVRLGPTHARESPTEIDDMVCDTTPTRDGEPNDLRTCACHNYAAPGEAAPTFREDKDRMGRREPPCPSTARGGPSKCQACNVEEVDSGTGIRCGYSHRHDPLYFDPLSYKSGGNRRRSKATKTICVPPPSYPECPAQKKPQQRQCPDKTVQYRDTRSDGAACVSTCPGRVRCSSRCRDNRPLGRIAIRVKCPSGSRSRRPFAVRSRCPLEPKVCTPKSPKKSSARCSKKRQTDYVAQRPCKKIIKRNPFAVCRDSSQIDDILPHEEYLDKYERNWKHRGNSCAGNRSTRGRNSSAGQHRYSEMQENRDNRGYPGGTCPRKCPNYASDETMVEQQEKYHCYRSPEEGACSRRHTSKKRPKKRAIAGPCCRICGQCGFMPTNPRGCIGLICRVKSKRSTAGSGPKGKLIILPHSQTNKLTTIYRSLGPPLPRRRVCRSRTKSCKSSYFPEAPNICRLRVRYVDPEPERCQGGRNGSVGEIRNRVRPRGTSVAEAPSVTPQRHASIPRQTSASARHAPSVHRHSNQGRSGAASPSRLPPNQSTTRRSPQQPQARHSGQPQAQAHPRHSQKPQAQARYSQQHREHLSPSHLEGRMFTASVNQSLPSIVRPIPVNPRSAPSRSFTPRIPSPQRLQAPANQTGEEKPRPSRAQNQGQSPTRTHYQETGPTRPPNENRGATRPHHQEPGPTRPQNQGRSPDRSQHPEAGPAKPQNENRGATRPQHQEPGPSKPPNKDRRDSKPHHSSPRQPSTPPSAHDLGRESRGPAAFYRGSFLRVRESHEHLNESSRGPVYRREPISHSRGSTRPGVLLNPDSQSVLETRTWPRMMQGYHGYLFGGPNIKSPGGWSWRRMLGSYLKRRSSKI
ncbi:serine/arginine repetitive matrix protein 1 [Drosophila persimilis]|uniref:serine/arginine repetitive matrix protein 1 n=1 Tax=Drosophila persimilis TaxID=7234 RepID=UPI000F07D079|nr:serine/arginine repetitive matrix protein 1 [Drosophila persimilis]